MRGEHQALARNMSAPPRSILTFAALSPNLGASGDPIADGAGLSLVCRLDFVGLLPKCNKKTVDRNGVRGVRRSEEYLRIAYPYARAETDERKRPTRQAYAHAKTTPIEDLADELRDLAAVVSLSKSGLPPFGLLLPTHGSNRAVEASLCKTIAILARRRGSVFLRDCDPVIWSAMEGEALDLWVPVAAYEKRA